MLSPKMHSIKEQFLCQNIKNSEDPYSINVIPSNPPSNFPPPTPLNNTGGQKLEEV